MNKVLRNFILDAGLFLMLALDIAATIWMPKVEASGHILSISRHIHAITGMLLTTGCLIHIGWHWRQIMAVITGKAKGGVVLFMQTLVVVMLLLAGMSGHAATDSNAAAGFHSFTGSIALIGMSIHGIKHMSWMTAVSKRFFIARQPA